MELVKELGMVENKSGNKFRMNVYICPQCMIEFNMYVCNFKKMKGDVCKSCMMVNRNTTHGLSGTYMHQVWNNMIARCYRKSSKNYKNWGGRGISVCDEWRDIKNFKPWFDENYRDGMQIDRINNDGNYEPSNCRFTSRLENLRNKRTIVGKKGKYRYVLWHGQSSGWRVKFKHRHIGYSKSEEDAYNMLKKDAEYQEYIKGREIFKESR